MESRLLFIVCMILLLIPNVAGQQKRISAADRIHQKACSINPYVGDDPWHITNLYNCNNKELFIPYQLWTGAKWSGDKSAECMHKVDRRNTLFQPADNFSFGEEIIRGPLLWQEPANNKQLQVWERIRPNINSHKYYTCHPRGIGAIHNLNKANVKYIHGLCHAPAGFGWKVGKRRTCIKTTLEIDDITLDENNHISSLTVKYWFRDKLRYHYYYRPSHGVVSIMRYRK